MDAHAGLVVAEVVAPFRVPRSTVQQDAPANSTNLLYFIGSVTFNYRSEVDFFKVGTLLVMAIFGGDRSQLLRLQFPLPFPPFLFKTPFDGD